MAYIIDGDDHTFIYIICRDVMNISGQYASALKAWKENEAKKRAEAERRLRSLCGAPFIPLVRSCLQTYLL